VGKPEGRSRRVWKNNTKIDIRGIGWGGMDWRHMAQDVDQWWALVNTAINIQVT
jgi:hypothetical protein